MKVIRCDRAHTDPILAILNEAILNSTAIYDYRPRTPEVMATWFEVKEKGNYPVIGAVGDGGEFMGFGSYGSFRAWPGYKYTAEHSVYVAPQFRGKGIGKILLKALIDAAQKQDYHVLIGGIDSQNDVSIRLHQSLGFVHAGTIRQAGFKFNRWLDLVFYQLILPTPAHPQAA